MNVLSLVKTRHVCGLSRGSDLSLYPQMNTVPNTRWTAVGPLRINPLIALFFMHLHREGNEGSYEDVLARKTVLKQKAQ